MTVRPSAGLDVLAATPATRGPTFARVPLIPVSRHRWPGGVESAACRRDSGTCSARNVAQLARSVAPRHAGHDVSHAVHPSADAGGHARTADRAQCRCGVAVADAGGRLRTPEESARQAS